MTRILQKHTGQVPFRTPKMSSTMLPDEVWEWQSEVKDSGEITPCNGVLG